MEAGTNLPRGTSGWRIVCVCDDSTPRNLNRRESIHKLTTATQPMKNSNGQSRLLPPKQLPPFHQAGTCLRLRRSFLALLLLFACHVAPMNSRAATFSTAGVPILAGNLSNFDLRYPGTQPDDLEILLYGDGLSTNDVTWTWDSSTPYGDPVNWGRPVVSDMGVSEDPNSPAFGLDCLMVRYAGPRRPDLVGKSRLHFGVTLTKPVIHQEIWWSLDGRRLRHCDPQVSWTQTPKGWLACIINPGPAPLYVYGCRFFQVPLAARLPLLDRMTLDLRPADFGVADWTPIRLPIRVTCLQPWCRIYLRLPTPNPNPILFQLAARNVGEDVLPLRQDPDLGPDPDDFQSQGPGEGEFGTMSILTTRATQVSQSDLNGDGAIGIPDFNLLRGSFGLRSIDAVAP